MRAAGRPSAPTVASVIAVGSSAADADRLVEPVRELAQRVGVDVRARPATRACTPSAGRRGPAVRAHRARGVGVAAGRGWMTHMRPILPRMRDAAGTAAAALRAAMPRIRRAALQHRCAFRCENAFLPVKMRYSRRRWSDVPVTGGPAPDRTAPSARINDRKENHGYCEKSCEEVREEAGSEKIRCQEAGREKACREKSCTEKSHRRKKLPRKSRPPSANPMPRS